MKVKNYILMLPVRVLRIQIVRFMGFGFIIGAFFGSSIGIASGGGAENGFFVVGVIGSFAGLWLMRELNMRKRIKQLEKDRI